ncbi:RHOMBOID-like protein 8 [Corylus avellana]|uniref:RHOMBOID-like protein 8 n=1 Tax=Corylus avellana TaxID=13451 RepID=UPI001E1FDEE9|nr:RHOMBOID-like protein 8 [Corylus avellana]
MADPSKLYSHIEIKAPPSPPPPPPSIPFSTDLAAAGLQDQRIPFFRSRSRRSRSGGDTWVISVFVILHVVAFFATMLVNDCWTISHQDCAFRALGRLSFQTLSENPLLGPSASTLDQMGALRRKFLTEYHQTWRLFTSPCLHAGAIHLVINLCSVIFVGIHLEQEFGPLRIGVVYILSAFVGTLVAALFVEDSPAVGSSGALYGLLGAMLSMLIRNWKIYTDKFAALASLFFFSVINFILGLLPYVDNFSNIGGFISGFLLGFVLLFSPQLRKVAQNKGDLYEYGVNKVSTKLKLKQKLDRPVLRSVCLLLFGLILGGCLLAVLQGVNMNQYCRWCQYVDCVPFKWWSCKDKATSCETMVSDAQLTLTCMSNGNFRVFPFTNISQARANDLCTLICR